MSNWISSAQPMLWLDLLPNEVCTRVATHVSNGAQSDALFNLAWTSPKQQEASLVSLSYSISLMFNRNTSNAPDWTSLIVQSIREVDLGLFASEAEYNTWAAALRLPGLHRATFTAFNSALGAISGSPSVRELCIGLLPENDLNMMFLSLSTLQITSLELCCGRDHEEDEEITHCIFSDPAHFSENGNSMAMACPRLNKLWVYCHSFEHDEGMLDFGFLRGLHSLEELKFNGNLPLPFLSQLRSIPSIRSEGHCCGMPALLVSSSLTEVHVKEPLDASSLARLSNCRKMEVLSIKLAAGAEESLPGTIRNLSCLHTLTLLWDEDNSEEDMRDEDDMTAYATAVSGSIFAVVEAARSLKSLCLHDVRIAIEELTQVLRYLGPRLEVFGTSIYNQEEAMTVRAEVLLLAVARYNSNLRDFKVSDRPGVPGARGNLDITSQQAEHLKLVYLYTQGRVPSLNSFSIGNVITFLQRSYVAM